MSERSAVQNPMLRYAEAIGWRFVPREEALRLRGGESGRIFAELLTAQMLRLNPSVVDVARAGEIVRQLGLLNPTIEGNRDALARLRGEHSVFVPEERRERNVRLIDFDNPDANIFQVTDEWTYRGTVYANRADVVFLINGIPISSSSGPPYQTPPTSASPARRLTSSPRARAPSRSSASMMSRATSTSTTSLSRSRMAPPCG